MDDSRQLMQRTKTSYARRGFTLFEMLMVLGLLSIIAIVALPSVRSWLVRMQIDQAASALRQMAHEAKRRAIQDGEPWGLSYSSKDNALRWSQPQRVQI